jgi:hypothetical protein
MVPEHKRLVLEKQLEELDKTLGERFHTFLEGRIATILADLQNSDCTFYDDPQQALEFIYYLIHQFFRTPKLRNLVARMDNPIPGLDLKRTWLIESHIIRPTLAAPYMRKGAHTSSRFCRTAQEFRS